MYYEIALQKSNNGSVANPVDFSGHWENQMGSTMELTVSGNAVSGTYTSKTSGNGGPVSGAIVGTTIGDLVSFTVLWQSSGAITAWVGQMVDDRGAEKIETLWHLITNVAESDEPTRLWTSTYTGSDRFLRQ